MQFCVKHLQEYTLQAASFFFESRAIRFDRLGFFHVCVPNQAGDAYDTYYGHYLCRIVSYKQRSLRQSNASLDVTHITLNDQTASLNSVEVYDIVRENKPSDPDHFRYIPIFDTWIRNVFDCNDAKLQAFLINLKAIYDFVVANSAHAVITGNNLNQVVTARRAITHRRVSHETNASDIRKFFTDWHYPCASDGSKTTYNVCKPLVDEDSDNPFLEMHMELFLERNLVCHPLPWILNQVIFHSLHVGEMYTCIFHPDHHPFVRTDDLHQFFFAEIEHTFEKYGRKHNLQVHLGGFYTIWNDTDVFKGNVFRHTVKFTRYRLQDDMLVVTKRDSFTLRDPFFAFLDYIKSVDSLQSYVHKLTQVMNFYKNILICEVREADNFDIVDSDPNKPRIKCNSLKQHGFEQNPMDSTFLFANGLFVHALPEYNSLGAFVLRWFRNDELTQRMHDYFGHPRMNKIVTECITWCGSSTPVQTLAVRCREEQERLPFIYSMLITSAMTYDCSDTPYTFLMGHTRFESFVNSIPIEVNV